MIPDRSQALRDAEEKVGQLRRFKQLGLAPLSGDFFVTVAYPPVSRYPRISEEDFFRGYAPPEDGAYGVYVHVPFCAKRCVFCHVPVFPRPTQAQTERYLAALEKEMDLSLRRLRLARIKASSILIGGGTPTHLPPPQLDQLLRALTSRLDRSRTTQMSVDVEPKTLAGRDGRRRLEILRSHGVGRICIGVDSFDDGLLRRMNRRYTARQAAAAVRLAQEMGFAVNVEFIYGYPGQTMNGWLDTVEQAISLEPDEIQLYRLRIIPYKGHEGTITRQFEADPAPFPSDEDITGFKQAAHTLLRGLGYEEHLHRVFSRQPAQHSHYSKGLSGTLQDTIAFGQSVRISFHDRFGVNARDFTEYYSRLEQGLLPVSFGKVRTRDEQLRWALILPLINWEVDKRAYERRTGESLDGLFRGKIGRLKAQGLLAEDPRSLALTPLGRFFANEVGYQFYHPGDMPLPESAFADAELNPYRDPGP